MSRTHPLHDPNGVAIIRCLNRIGQPAGYLHETGCYAEGEGELFRPLKFSSTQQAAKFLFDNSQWEPADVDDVANG